MCSLSIWISHLKQSCCYLSLTRNLYQLDICKKHEFEYFLFVLKDISKYITFITKITVLQNVIDSLYPNYVKHMFQLSWYISTCTLYFSKVLTISNFRKKSEMAAKRTANEPHGTIFRLGDIKIRCLHTLGIPKMYVKIYIIRVHGTP